MSATVLRKDEQFHTVFQIQFLVMLNSDICFGTVRHNFTSRFYPPDIPSIWIQNMNHKEVPIFLAAARS